MTEDNRHVALLVMDVQLGIVERQQDSSSYLARLRRAIEGARAARVPVMYVRVAFRRGEPEISPNNRSFSALASTRTFTEDDPVTQIHPSVAPEDGDVVVVKRRVSAFTGSDLDVVLRARQIDSLVLTGIATSGVVLSTLREAADRDFKLVVISDCCMDMDAEVHRVLTEKVFTRQADVLTVDEWVSQLS